jgi:hypothetical protein
VAGLAAALGLPSHVVHRVHGVGARSTGSTRLENGWGVSPLIHANMMLPPISTGAIRLIGFRHTERKAMPSVTYKRFMTAGLGLCNTVVQP